MNGRKFTWANSLPEPTYEKLDCVIMDTEWENKYPLVSVRALEQIESLSDHAPILFSSGVPKPHMQHHFKFELGWLHRDGFDDLVKEVWSRPVAGASPIQRWNNKMRKMCSFL